MVWDPDTYPSSIRAEIHDYDALQRAVVTATAGASRTAILELGIGAGETARRLLDAHPSAVLTGIDSSPEMLRAAAGSLPAARVTLLEQDLADPLPEGLFDLIVSALAIHHLEGDGKAQLFHRIHERLAPEGSFVMGDVIVPDDPDDVVIECEPGYDFPDRIETQLGWMAQAGLSPEVTWLRGDLAVFRAAPTA